MNKQETLIEIYDFLVQVHLDKRNEYPMVIKDEKGEREVKYNREQYLEFVVDVVVEQLGNSVEDMD